MVIGPYWSLVGIALLGALAQWLAWRLRLPSIVVLLVVGFTAGPLTGFLNPDALLGDLLLPAVSLSVAIILFEGGLNLRFAELRTVGAALRNLMTVGTVITWTITAFAAHGILQFDPGLSALIGALLVVTGPTVILPLLRHVRPSGRVGPLLKWEGIVNDPIGAILAVVVFEFLMSGGGRNPASHIAFGLARTVVLGGGIGVIAGYLFAFMLKRYWIPESLLSLVTVASVIGVFAVSNAAQHESGLLAVTLMGIVLANQPLAAVKRIAEFKENLQPFLVAALFILLSARVSPEALMIALNWRTLTFVAVLIFVARPLSVFVSAIGCGIPRRERIAVAWMAPRGIVAAAVSAVFAINLQHAGYAQARLLVPVVFATIIATVVIYGLTAGPVARRLGLADRDAQGLLVVGAQDWARAIAQAIKSLNFRVVLLDKNDANIAAARLAGLPTYAGSALAEHALVELDLTGVGRLLAMTSNDEVNMLSVHQFLPIFGRPNVFQLSPKDQSRARAETEHHLHGRWLFNPGATYEVLQERFNSGAVVKATKLTPEFDYAAFQGHYGEAALPMFVITEAGKLTVVSADQPFAPKPGQSIVSMVVAPVAAELPPAVAGRQAR